VQSIERQMKKNQIFLTCPDYGFDHFQQYYHVFSEIFEYFQNNVINVKTAQGIQYTDKGYNIIVPNL
jgi:hypothetical protein